jgi:hypothetical protein
MRDDFHEAVRYWRLFKVMQTQGYINYEELLLKGAVATCPACPLPGVNLPEGWDKHIHRYAIIQHENHSVSYVLQRFVICYVL